MGGPSGDDGSSTTVPRRLDPHDVAPSDTSHLAKVRGRSTVIALRWGAATHVGNVRAVNEDAVCVASPVFLVADGMGGHDGGDVASSLVAGALASFPTGKAVSRGSVLASVAAANDLVYEHSGRGDKVMGTTVTGIAFTDEAAPSLLIFNVGDSRTYLVEGASFVQVTKDHSYVQELVDSRQIDAADAAHHAERNVVTRAVGIEPEVEIDAITVPVRAGQRWMMCSDGLSGEVEATDIQRILSAGEPQVAADGLIAAVLDGRGGDNVSVVVVDVVSVEDLDDPDRTDRRPKRGVGASPSQRAVDPLLPAPALDDGGDR